MAKKFTKSQLKALEALRTYIVSFEPGTVFAALASLQLKINTEMCEEDDLLQWMQVWCVTLLELLSHIMHPQFRKDLEMALDQMIDAFPDHFNKACSEDIKVH